jgi:hypothetical protein
VAVLARFAVAARGRNATMSNVDDPREDEGAEAGESPEEFAEELESDPARNPEDEELKEVQGG